LLWIIHIIKNDSLKNIQIKVNIPFLYFAASNRQCRRFIVNHRVRFFSDISRCKHWLFLKNFSDIFLISPTSDPSDFLLNRAVCQVSDTGSPEPLVSIIDYHFCGIGDLCIFVSFERNSNGFVMVRPDKKICVFMVTCQKNLGSVGRH
jgi:hypothetical protein